MSEFDQLCEGPSLSFALCERLILGLASTELPTDSRLDPDRRVAVRSSIQLRGRSPLCFVVALSGSGGTGPSGGADAGF